MRRKGFFVLALICGLIAAGSVYIFLNDATKNVTSTLKPLVIVKQNIPARTIVSTAQLEVKDVPTQGYPQGGFSTLQSVAGSVSLLNLFPGDILVNTMLEPQNSSSGVSGGTTALTIPNGKRAVAIPVSLVSGVGNAIKPGDHVDVLVTMDIKNSAPDSQTVTVTSLAAQDVLVLSVGEPIPGDKTKAEIKSHTLALSVPQAMAVTLGSEKGSLRLLLRNPSNTEIRADKPITAKDYLDPTYFERFK